MKGTGHAGTRVSYLVKWVERGLRVRMDAALARYDLTTPEYTALSVLQKRDGLSSAQLARRTLVSAQAMNQVVIRLETRRLIARTPDPEHARSQRISLTTTGKTLLVACDRATLDTEEQMLAQLSRTQVQAFRSALETCVAALGSSD